MKSELPPPVTRNSSKATLWGEIKAMEQEIEDQQRRIVALDKAVKESAGRVALMEWQIAVIRSVIGKSA